MSVREREGLIARIRQLRRAAPDARDQDRGTMESSERDDLAQLAGRVAHLEQLLQGLQDSVHRESLRQSKRIAELEARIQPAELSKALSEHVRDRGL